MLRRDFIKIMSFTPIITGASTTVLNNKYITEEDSSPYSWITWKNRPDGAVSKFTIRHNNLTERTNKSNYYLKKFIYTTLKLKLLPWQKKFLTAVWNKPNDIKTIECYYKGQNIGNTFMVSVIGICKAYYGESIMFMSEFDSLNKQIKSQVDKLISMLNPNIANLITKRIYYGCNANQSVGFSGTYLIDKFSSFDKREFSKLTKTNNTIIMIG